MSGGQGRTNRRQFDCRWPQSQRAWIELWASTGAMDNGQCVSLSHLHAVHAHSDSIHLCIRGILGKSSLWLAGYDCLGCQTPKNDDKSPLACNRWSIRCCLIFASRKELHTIMRNNAKRNEVIYVHTQLLLVWRKSHCFQTPCLPLASLSRRLIQLWCNISQILARDITSLLHWAQKQGATLQSQTLRIKIALAA